MPNNLQDDAEDCLGEMFVSNVVINKLEVEVLLKVDCIEELNEGCNIDIKDNIIAHKDLGVSGCLFLNQPLINLRNPSTFDDSDIGFFSAYQDLGTTYYTGLIRDADDGVYKLFDGSTNIIDLCKEVDLTGITYADLEIGRLNIKRPLDEDSLAIAGTEYGDIFVGVTNGTVQRLPLGLENQVLTVAQGTDLGVQWEFNAEGNIKGESGSWAQSIPGFDYTRVSSNITLLGADNYTRLFRKKYFGTKNFSITNEIEDGPSAFFHTSKSKRELSPHIVKTVGLTSYTGGLRVKWDKYVNIEGAKCTEDNDGDYLVISNYDPECAPPNIRDEVQPPIDLLGITWFDVDTEAIKGNYMFNVENDICGPVGTFYLSKSTEDSDAHVVRISHSPSDDKNSLKMQWKANSPIQLRKTKTTYDGIYRVTPLHDQFIREEIVNLTGQNFSGGILYEYERVTTIVGIEPLDNAGATAIFHISKNHLSNKFHVFRVSGTASGGGWDRLEIIGVDPPSINAAPTNLLIVDGLEIVGVPNTKCFEATAPLSEFIELVWEPCEELKIRKTDKVYGNSVFDGQYRVRFYDYFPC